MPGLVLPATALLVAICTASLFRGSIAANYSGLPEKISLFPPPPTQFIQFPGILTQAHVSSFRNCSLQVTSSLACRASRDRSSYEAYSSSSHTILMKWVWSIFSVGNYGASQDSCTYIYTIELYPVLCYNCDSKVLLIFIPGYMK